MRKLFLILAVAFALYHLYAAQFGILPGMYKHYVLHVTGALVLVFLRSLLARKRRTFPATIVDLLLIALSLTAGGYVFLNDALLAGRVGNIMPADVYCGIIYIIVLLEATRRVVGVPITAIAATMLLYCYLGRYMPDIIAHRGFSVNRIAYYMFLNLDGIFGVATRVASTVIILFVLFGSFLKATRGGDYFTDLAYSIFGKFRGGPAKIAIVGSSLFGMVSGSAIANVVSTGAFTIPLMKRVGYRPVFAAAVESVASTGGQIMPPIMGASAFLIMEILKISYVKVILAALIPALLYYVALFVAVDLEAKKMGLTGLTSEDLPNAKDILKKSGLILMAPLLLVFFLAVFQWSPMKAAFGAIVAIFAASCLNSETRMGLADVVNALRDGAVNALEASIICAAAGLIIGAFTLTGLGLKFSNILISLSGGNLMVLLILTMIASLILGMGMPTVACYVVLAVLVAPALIKMNIHPVAAHMFIFYFGIISNITPPVCVAAYAGAGIAKANPFNTGFMASRLGIVGFIVPYMFVMGPALLFQGGLGNVLLSLASALVGVTVLAMAFEGIFIQRLNIVERSLLFVAAIVLLKVGMLTDLVGYGLILAVLAFHWRCYRHKTKGAQANAAA